MSVLRAQDRARALYLAPDSPILLLRVRRRQGTDGARPMIRTSTWRVQGVRILHLCGAAVTSGTPRQVCLLTSYREMAEALAGPTPARAQQTQGSRLRGRSGFAELEIPPGSERGCPDVHYVYDVQQNNEHPEKRHSPQDAQ